MNTPDEEKQRPGLVARVGAMVERTLARLYSRVDHLTGGRLAVVRRAIEGFGAARSAQSAAGMAYYAFFSLFPLVLFLVGVSSSIFVQERESAVRQAINLIRRAIPVSRSLIQENVQQVVDARGTVGIIGAVGTLWSATGFFSILSTNVNRAWPGAEPRNFFEQRLVALGMIAILILLLALSLASTAVLNLLSPWQIPVLENLFLYKTPLWRILGALVPWIFALLLFLALYRWTPNTHVPWRAAAWAALIVSAAWQVAASAFTWYVGSGMARYQLVYGSLGAIIALLFWIYLASWFTLFGAHLAAAIAVRPYERSPEEDGSGD